MATEAERLMALFAGHGGAHGTHGEPAQVPGSLKWAIKGTARFVREAASLTLWQQHLAGTRPLGIIPIDEQSNCRWGSIDYDIYDDDMLGVIERLERSGAPLVPCRSKSGGLHLFIFFQQPQKAALVIPALRDLAAHLGLMVRPEKTDIFPAQSELLTERGDLGNWLVMPYFGVNGPPGCGTYGGKIREQYGVKKTGAEMTLGEFLRAAEFAAQVTIPTPKAAPRQRAAGGAKRGNGAAPDINDYSDGPPCLQHLVAGEIIDDGRKRALFHMGIYHKKRGEDWKINLERSNIEQLHPPLPAEEVLGIIRSLERKDYDYTCQVEPMKSHCDSQVCRFRRYGIGDPGDVPVITGIRYLDIENPIWFVDIAGAKTVEVGTEQLKNYQLFHTRCMEQFHICYGMVKQATWLDQLRLAMERVEPIAAPAEVGILGQFIEFLQEFCTNRQSSDRREDMLRGSAWHDKENARFWFQLKDFMTFLQRERVDMRAMGRGKVVTYIREIGGGHKGLAIKAGYSRNCYWVPATRFQDVPEPDEIISEGEPL